MLGPITTPISVNNISIVVASPQVVTMTTSCSSRLEEVNGVVLLSRLLNIFTAELRVCLSFKLLRLIVLRASKHLIHLLSVRFHV